MYRIALNTAITGLRRRGRQPVQVPIADAAAVPSPLGSGSDARTEILYRAVRSLGDIDRALVMCYLEDLSYREIADLLGLSESNVGARLSRTKAKLQDLVRGLVRDKV